MLWLKTLIRDKFYRGRQALQPAVKATLPSPGNTVDLRDADLQPAVKAIPPSPNRERFRLRFTGTCSRENFQQRCREHDFWYHSYYFDNGFEQRGDYDIGLDLAEYDFPSDLTGMSVLDIGTGSGWFATYFEQQGATVTTVDLRGICDFDLFGRDHHPGIDSEKPVPDLVLPDGRPIYYSPVSKGYWIMKDLLGLQSEFVNARVYELNPRRLGGRKFDLVFMGSVLMHLRDPIGALMAAHSVCRHRLIATTYLLEDPVTPSLMRLFENGAGGLSWWTPNRACLAQWLQAAGFSHFNLDHQVHLTADKPFVDPKGHTSGITQVQQLISAQV